MLLTCMGVAAGGVPGPGGAGSGYLVQEGSTSLLVDCGNGVLGNVARCVPLQRIDAVYLSHLHADHFSDLYPLLLQRTRFGRLRVLGPPGAQRKLDAWFNVLSGNPDLYRSALDLEEFDGGATLKVGSLRVTPRAVEHSVPSYACTIEAGRRRLAYSSDTRACDALVEAARDAGVFLCEATLQEGVGDAEFVRRQLQAHMTATQAGQVAAKAGARSLLLTHLMYYLDADASQRQAQAQCLCPVGIAREHARYEV